MSDLKQCEVISVRKINGEGNLKAFVDIRIGGGLVVKGCTVLNGKKGLFASLPRKVNNIGQWQYVVVPVDDELKSRYQSVIMAAFEEKNGSD